MSIDQSGDSRATSRVRLNGVWEVARVEANQVETPQQIENVVGQWRQAVVPGTVAQVLWRDGVWNWETPVEIDAADWWYRCRFARGDVDAGERVSLVFEGLATIADVWMNGTHLLHSENMYCANRVDVTRILQDTNVLYIRFASIKAALAKRRPRPAWRTKLVEQQQLRWIRTTLLGRMPGWSAGPQAVGPWGEVAVEVHSAVEVVERDVRTSVRGDRGVVEIALQVRGKVEHATVTVGEHTVALECEAQGDVYRKSRTAAAQQVGATRVGSASESHNEPRYERDEELRETTVVRGSLTLPDVELWWPHTHGGQRRYPATVVLYVGGESYTVACGALAFRTVELDTEDGDFMFRINGVPVFCRGACWSTVDVVGLRGTWEQYRDALLLARDAGMNMIRVGGTMVYEDDAFYELCDELGILVWQDFMFANMDYPVMDDEFAKSVREEIGQVLRRTQTYACLAVWCGNSEIEQQTAMLGLPKEQWSNAFFRETLPAMCRAVRPDVPYWPSSPSGGTLPFQVNVGDAHYFGYGPYLRTYDDVRTSRVKFASEALAFAHVPELATIDLIPGGVSGAGHHPAWKAGVPRDNGASWDFEDVRDYYVGELFGVRPAELRYGDVERYVALGRVASGEVIGRAFAHWRRPSSGCWGALLWLYRDLRPGAGWGVVDAMGRPKAAYYATRRASLPVTVFLEDEGLNGVVATAVNDSAVVVEATLKIVLYHHGELVMGEAHRELRLAPHSAEEIHVDGMFEGFRDLSYAYRFGPPNHDLVVATLTDRKSGALLGDAFFFPIGLSSVRELDLGVTAEVRAIEEGCYALRVGTRRFAQSVTIDVSHFRASDNYFHLAPNSDKTIVLCPLPASMGDGTRARQPAGTVTPLNSSVSSRIIVL